MDRTLAKTIFEDMQSLSLKRMESSITYLHPFSPAYIPVELSEQHFTCIHPHETENTLIFIDGGNTEILNTPDCTLHALRFAAVGFQNRKKVFQTVKEGYILVSSQEKILVTSYGLTLPFPELSLDDPLLINSDQRTKLSFVANLYRSLYELSFAQELLQRNSLIVLDRSLLSQNIHEESLLSTLLSSAEQKKSLVCGLNKTTSLLCNTGESVIHALHTLEPASLEKKSWCYYPLFSTFDLKHNAILSFVKLHNASKHIFRLELHALHKDALYDVVSWLASQSDDGAFVGYPYGLIVADQLARISNKEKEYLKTLFTHFTGKQEGTALNAHDVLDQKL